MSKILEILKSVFQKRGSREERAEDVGDQIEEVEDKDEIVSKRYRAGQKVWIVKDLSKVDAPINFNSKMSKFCNKMVTISAVRSCECCYSIKEDGGKYQWSGFWFKKEDSVKEIIEIKDESVILYNEKNGQRKKRKEITLQRLLEKIQQRNSGIVQTPPLPEGARFYFKKGDVEVVIIEQFPQTRTVFWANEKRRDLLDMPEKEKKRFLTMLSFPYVIFIIPFLKGGILSDCIKCFYRNEPLESCDYSLLMTNLKNVHYNGNVCIGKKIEAVGAIKEQAEKYLNLFWQSSFNNDIDTAFDITAGIDKRVSFVEKWQEESKKNPNFITKINWIKTEFTILTVIREIIKDFKQTAINDIDDIIDLIYQVEEE